MPATTTRRGDLLLGQFVSDLLDRQVAKLNQDRPQCLCLSIRFALVLLRLLDVAELDAARLSSRERLLGSDRDVPPLLLGQRGVYVQHEWINVRTQFRDDEGNLLDHQPADEVHISAQPIQLGDDDRTLAGLDLGKFGRNGKALAAGKLRVRRTLCLKAKA